MNCSTDRTSPKATRCTQHHRFTLFVCSATAMALLLAGCASSSPQNPAPEGMDDMSPPQILYEAIVVTYESQEIPIDISSRESLIVTSEPQQEESDLRKSINSRVVRAAPGAMGLKVNTEWEKRETVDGKEVWKPVESKELSEESQGDEVALARDIEECFEDWKGEWKADQRDEKS